MYFQSATEFSGGDEDRVNLKHQRKQQTNALIPIVKNGEDYSWKRAGGGWIEQSYGEISGEKKIENVKWSRKINKSCKYWIENVLDSVSVHVHLDAASNIYTWIMYINCWCNGNLCEFLYFTRSFCFLHHSYHHHSILFLLLLVVLVVATHHLPSSFFRDFILYRFLFYRQSYTHTRKSNIATNEFSSFLKRKNQTKQKRINVYFLRLCERCHSFCFVSW